MSHNFSMVLRCTLIAMLMCFMTELNVINSQLPFIAWIESSIEIWQVLGMSFLVVLHVVDLASLHGEDLAFSSFSHSRPVNDTLYETYSESLPFWMLNRRNNIFFAATHCKEALNSEGNFMASDNAPSSGNVIVIKPEAI